MSVTDFVFRFIDVSVTCECDSLFRFIDVPVTCDCDSVQVPIEKIRNLVGKEGITFQNMVRH